MGLGDRTIGELADFSQALLPTLAAATAARGRHTPRCKAGVHGVLRGSALRLIRALLLPLVYLYIGLLTAAACLPENRLGAIAEALKKAGDLDPHHGAAGVHHLPLHRADHLRLRRQRHGEGGKGRHLRRGAGGGGIIADASETVLAGAGMLKNTIGVFGMLAILAACAYPFLQLGVQYLLYKLTAYLASGGGAPGCASSSTGWEAPSA